MTSAHDGPLVTFVVPVLNDAARLARCLASISATVRDRVEIVVVDNGSTDGSDRVATHAGATVVSKPGVPVAALRNAGARVAHGAILAFVDADHEIAPGWAAAARAALDDPRTAAAGAPYTAEGRTWVQRAYDGLRGRSPVRRRVAWLGSGNMAVRRTAFVDVHGFDERLQTCEDVDLCRRLRAAGGDIVEDPGLASVHAGDPATLRAVFFGELWRGRDNLYVSFRRPLDMRGVVTALVPAGTLFLVALAVVSWRLGAARWCWLAGALLAVPVLLRTIQLSSNRRDWRPLAMAQALAVALFFEAGRALALVARSGHRTRRAAPRERAEAARE